MMKLRVRLFASFREAVGGSRAELELPPAATVGDLLAALRQAYPRLGPAVRKR